MARTSAGIHDREAALRFDGGVHARLPTLDPPPRQRYCLSTAVPYAEPTASLRLKLRRAIDKEGLYAFAKRSGVQPSTVQRLAYAAGHTPETTLAKVQGALT